jgi:hypothetical protein
VEPRLVCFQTSELDLVKPLLSSTYIANEVRLPVDRRDLVSALHHLMGEEIGEFTRQTASLRSATPFDAPLIWVRARRSRGQPDRVFLTADFPDGTADAVIVEEIKQWREHAVLLAKCTDGLHTSEIFRVTRIGGKTVTLNAYPRDITLNERYVMARLEYIEPSVSTLCALNDLSWQCNQGTPPPILAELLDTSLPVVSEGWRSPAAAMRSASVLRALFQFRDLHSPLGLAVRPPSRTLQGSAARPPPTQPLGPAVRLPPLPLTTQAQVPSDLDAEFRLIVDSLTACAELPLPRRSPGLPCVQMSDEQHVIVTGLSAGVECLHGVAGKRAVSAGYT